MVESGELGLIQPLHHSQHTGVDDSQRQVGVGALKLVTALQVAMRRVLHSVGAAQYVCEEREPSIRCQSLMAPVVQLGEDKCRNDQFLGRIGDERGARRMVGVGGIERREQDARIESQCHLRRSMRDRLGGGLGCAAAIVGASDPQAWTPRAPDLDGLLFHRLGKHCAEAASAPPRLRFKGGKSFHVGADCRTAVHDA